MIQSAIGLLQGFGILNSLHSLFAVTGTFGNPGPFGGYIAMAAALTLPCMSQGRLSPYRRGLLFACLAIAISALVWSGSRAAWCAFLSAALLFLYLKIPARRQKLKWGITILWVMSIPIASMLLYLYRPASADARMFIWRVCGDMISQHPLTGVGTGRFAAHYMPSQAGYLMTASETVRRNADDNLFAYNETLTILCEQGVVGLCLATAFWILALRGLKSSFESDGKKVLLFPAIALLVFAQFSYPLSLWSFTSLFVFIAAMGTHDRYVCRPLHAVPLSFVCIALLATGCALRWRSQDWIHRYALFATRSDYPGHVVEWTIRHDPYLLACHADAAFLRTDYETALKQMERLAHYARSARWTVRKGECHEATGDTLKALDAYQTASRMMPGLLYPLFAEFNLCRKSNNKERASLLARKIIASQPKIDNSKTRNMKREALLYIRSESKSSARH